MERPDPTNAEGLTNFDGILNLALYGIQRGREDQSEEFESEARLNRVFSGSEREYPHPEDLVTIGLSNKIFHFIDACCTRSDVDTRGRCWIVRQQSGYLPKTYISRYWSGDGRLKISSIGAHQTDGKNSMYIRLVEDSRTGRYFRGASLTVMGNGEQVVVPGLSHDELEGLVEMIGLFEETSAFNNTYTGTFPQKT